MSDRADRDAARLGRLRALFEGAGCDALIVCRRENVRYLSGFTGSAGALRITPADATVVTDSRYAEQAAAEAPGFAIEVASGIPALIAASRTPARRIGLEEEGVTHALWRRIRGVVEEKGPAVLIPCMGLVEGLRARKDPEEIALIEKAIAITVGAFEATRPLIRPGVTERDLALEIEFRMKQAGAENVAFDLIVASGPRAALPHGRASGRSLGAGEFVVFDIGARYEGYHSDLTRTIFTGSPGSAERSLYETVALAQRRALEAVRAGVKGGDVDEAARRVIREAGHGDRFGHGTGHGVGLEVHESPRIGAGSEDLLDHGMVVTVEPGVYLPGECGLRIEDMVVVSPGGARRLTPPNADAWALG